jgi:hypothetical protein
MSEKKQNRPKTEQPSTPVNPTPPLSGLQEIVPVNSVPGLSPYPTPIDPNRGALANVLNGMTPETPLTECPSNLNPADPFDRKCLFDASNPGDYNFDKNDQVVITAVRWLIHAKATADEETGEVRVHARTCFFDKEGKFFATNSEHAPRKILLAHKLHTAEEWQHGITFLIQRVTGQRKRVYHKICMVLNGQVRFDPT